MSRFVILSAGPVADSVSLRALLQPDDRFIAADGGWRLAQTLGVTPEALVADFDSMPPPALPPQVSLIRLPVQKDVTDTAAAAQYAYEAGGRDFLFLGCTGGRLDHQHAALLVAAGLVSRGCRAVLADEHNWIEPLTPCAVTLEPALGCKLSLFAFGGPVRGLSVSGAAYGLADYDLDPLDPLCVSNEFADVPCHLSFREGLLLVYRSKD